MTAPIKRNQKTEGFLILTSKRKNIFQAIEMKIVDVLTGYFAISLVKARYYEKTVEQSERCGLTNLHNFRYLDAKLDEEIIRFHTGDINSLSVLMLDIDHFKLINDTYGHQSGNDLLKLHLLDCLNHLFRLKQHFHDMEGKNLSLSCRITEKMKQSNSRKKFGRKWNRLYFVSFQIYLKNENLLMSI